VKPLAFASFSGKTKLNAILIDYCGEAKESGRPFVSKLASQESSLYGGPDPHDTFMSSHIP